MEANRDLLEQRWPGLWSKLETAAGELELERVKGAPEFTLHVSGMQLTGAYDRHAEATRQARGVPGSCVEATVYGLGLGDLPRILLERDSLKCLRVVVLSSKTAMSALRALDQTDWLGDPRVQLVACFAGELNVHGEDLDPEAGREVMEFWSRGAFAVHPVELKLADRLAYPVRDDVVLALSRGFQRAMHEQENVALSERIQDRRPLFEKDPDVAELFGSRPGVQAVVVGGGPSLDQQLEKIRADRENLLVIVVTRALGAVVAGDVIPDLAVVVDPLEATVEHLEAVDLTRLKETPLVYIPSVHPRVIDMWLGPRRVAFLNTPLYMAVRQQLERGTLYCSGTVTHAAVDLAVRMGACRVTLAGVDLAYPDQRSHAENSPQEDVTHAARGGLRVTNGNGEEVLSSPSLIGFLRDLERYVSMHPDVKFFNTGKMGACIEGVPWLEDDDAIAVDG